MSEQQPKPPKPVPYPSIETQFFWDKVNEDELWVQRCIDCGGKPYFYPRFFCPTCLSMNVEWFKTTGKGKLHTYMINHRPPPAFADEAPYAIAVVELDEGVKMMTNIHGIEITPENLVLDMPLEVTFEEIAPGRKIPYWKPAGR
jgi:uncharacterized OB-fold protein